jgi:hypothetical protein
MSFFWGSLTGMLVGIYYAEKSFPFPLAYRSGPNGSAGAIEFDLQIVNSIVSDVRGAVGYGPVLEAEPVAPK